MNSNEWQVLLLGSIGLTLALIALAWVITVQRLDAEKALISKNALSRQDNLSIIIAENLTQVLDRGRLMSIAANEWFEGNREDSQNRLSAMLMADKAYLRIALYNHNFQQVFASSPAVDSGRLKTTLHEVLLRPPDENKKRLYFVPAPENHEQAWQVPIFFPVLGNDGKVRGGLLVTLDLGYFLGLYQEIDIGHSGAIQLFKEDGEQIVEANQAGLSLANPPSRKLTQSQSDTGPPRIIGATAGQQAYLSSFRKIDNYPFSVAVSREENEVFADYFVARNRFIRSLGVLTLIVALMIWGMTNSIRRQARLFSALEAADQEKRELIILLEEERLRALRMAAHDPLTGLPNRRMFNELVLSHLAGAGRSSKVYALLFLDLDRFKQVNDDLGHHVGDLLLQTIAHRLTATLRESDVVARLGGDEFAVLLTNLESIDDAAHTAAKLVEEISRPCMNLDGNDVQVGTSIGIAIFPRDGHDFSTLCQNADAAMYLAKRGGRGRYAFHDQELNLTVDRLDCLESCLPEAIANNELLLHFQPKVRLSDFRIVGFETLVRWLHPEFGLISASEFIARAEHSGSVVALGDWVFDACCRQLSAWQKEGMSVVPIACNVSAKQLIDRQLPDRFADILLRHDVDGQLFEIEITESSLLASPEISGDVLKRLEQQGMRVAIDNFGNGFSSLTHIRQLPIHALKIDCGFVSDIHNSPDDARTIASIITLAHNLRLRVVAVGVESIEQLVHLKTAGCDDVQGYFLSRPVSAAQARRLLKKSFLLPNV
jgi:diguanylate cyclase (GGDEF)-like protein